MENVFICKRCKKEFTLSWWNDEILKEYKANPICWVCEDKINKEKPL